VNRGISYRQSGKYDLALADYSEAIRRQPDNVGAHASRALVYLVQKQFDAAIADYSALIRLQPKEGDHYANRCIMLTRAGRPEEGLKDCQQALNSFPMTYTVWKAGLTPF
jgi:Tfp pilus assembly protein PilF